PSAAGHELERSGGDLLARTGNTDDDGLTPAAVRALEGGAHHLHISDALEGVIDAPGGHLDDHLLDGLVMVLRIDAIGGAHGPRHRELRRIGIDGDDAAGPGLARTLDHRKTDAAQAKHRDAVTRLHFGGVLHGAKSGGDAAAEQADLTMIGSWIDLRQRN